MAKLTILALFVVLLAVLHMMPSEANGQETPSVSGSRSKFPPSGSIFGKRAYYGEFISENFLYVLLKYMQVFD